MNTPPGISRQNEHGFSLVELLIVVGAIGILVNLSFPVFEHARKKAQVARIVSDFQTVRRMATDYFIKNGRWPAEAGEGIEPPELQTALARAVRWDGRFPYDWDNLVGADNQSSQPESGVRVGFSVRTHDEEVLRMIRDSPVAPFAETWGSGITFVIEGTQTSSGAGGGDTSGGGGSSGGGGNASGGGGSPRGGGNGSGGSGNGRGRGRGRG